MRNKGYKHSEETIQKMRLAARGRVPPSRRGRKASQDQLKKMKEIGLSLWPDIISRFHDSYIPVTESGCWLWEKCITGSGYGAIRDRGKNLSAHRISYELHIGPISDNLTIDHLCGIRTCVNPSHMELVSQGENTRRANIKRYSRKEIQHGGDSL